MKPLANLRPHFLILAVAALVVGGARMVFREQYAQELKRVGQSATDARAREAEAYWKTFSYTDASAPGFPDTFVAAIDWPALQLSAVQKERLQPRLRQVIGYLSHPTLDGYWRLRAEGLHYQFLPTRTVHVMWTNVLHRRDAELLGEPLATATAIWKAAEAIPERHEFSRLAAVCLTNVAAATSRSNTFDSIMRGPVRKGFTAVRAAMNPGFEYPALDKLPLDGPNAPVYLHLSFFAKVKEGDRAGPVYVSLSWLPEDQAWAVGRLLSDTWLTLHSLF